MTVGLSDENPCNTLGFSSLLVNEGLLDSPGTLECPAFCSLFWLQVARSKHEGTTSLEGHLSAPDNTTNDGSWEGQLVVQLPMTDSWSRADSIAT